MAVSAPSSPEAARWIVFTTRSFARKARGVPLGEHGGGRRGDRLEGFGEGLGGLLLVGPAADAFWVTEASWDFLTGRKLLSKP